MLRAVRAAIHATWSAGTEADGVTGSHRAAEQRRRTTNHLGSLLFVPWIPFLGCALCARRCMGRGRQERRRTESRDPTEQLRNGEETTNNLGSLLFVPWIPFLGCALCARRCMGRGRQERSRTESRDPTDQPTNRE